MFTFASFATLTSGTLREASTKFFAATVSTMSVFLSQPETFGHTEKALGLVIAQIEFFDHDQIAFAQRSDKADLSAPRFIFFGNSVDQSRGCGPCTLPPPFHSGERMLAIRPDQCPFVSRAFCRCPTHCHVFCGSNRTLALVGLVILDCVVDQRFVQRDAKHVFAQLNLTHDLIFQVFNV